MLFLGHLAGTKLGTLTTLTTLAITPFSATGSMTLTLYLLHIWFISSPYDAYTP